MDHTNPTFGVPDNEPTQPKIQSDFQIINETPNNSARSGLAQSKFGNRATARLSQDNNSNYHSADQQNNSFSTTPSQTTYFPSQGQAATSHFHDGHAFTTPDSKEQLPSFSQLETIMKLIKCIKEEPNESADRSLAEKMINIAPRFDLRNVEQSLKEFNIFFDVNSIKSDCIKFLIIQGMLPWTTMVQFGEQFPNCGSNLTMLISFLRANIPVVSPSMNFVGNISKFGDGSLFRNMYHTALMASQLDKSELVKLFCFIFTNNSKRALVHEYMDLPFEQYLNKISKKWEKGQNSISKSYGPQPHTQNPTNAGTSHEFINQSWPSTNRTNATEFQTQARSYYNNNNNNKSTNYTPHRNNNGPNLCFYHQNHGNNAIKCMGPPCERAGQTSRPNQTAKNDQPQV